MDSIFGIVGKDFVLLAADCKVARSILVYKDDEDKVRSFLCTFCVLSLSTLVNCSCLFLFLSSILVFILNGINFRHIT